MISSVRSAGSTWRSRTRCACPATARWDSRWTIWRCWSSRLARRARNPASSTADKYELCANLHLAECNWLVEKDPVRKLCTSCALTRTRPNDADTKALAAFAESEKAKRRLIAELFELKLPIIGRDEDPDFGLAFDLLSSEHEKVFTGHRTV